MSLAIKHYGEITLSSCGLGWLEVILTWWPSCFHSTQSKKLRKENFFFFFLPFLGPFPRHMEVTPKARGLIGTIATGLHHSHSNTGSEPHLQPYTTTHSNTGSLTHWARPGIEPTTSWFPVGFVSHWAMTGTPGKLLMASFEVPDTAVPEGSSAYFGATQEHESMHFLWFPHLLFVCVYTQKRLV